MVELIKIGTESRIREREKFLLELKNNSKIEGVLLQTCNRVEFYSGEGSIPGEIAIHLFRVVSGFESSIIGETALFTGKKVRTKTGISTGAMSHSQTAVDLLFQNIADVASAIITIIAVNTLNEKEFSAHIN